MKTEYLPFSSEMIPEAGKLLAKRHICNRQVLPLLPHKFEDPRAASKAVENLWQSRFRNGYAAFRKSTIEWKERWAIRADNEERMVWMALEKNKTVGTVAFLFEHPSALEQDAELQMLASASTLTLGTAVTKPEVRGRGIANILTWRGLEQARAIGFDVCLVNWIGPNLLASRYWPRFGFQPAAYRLSKQIHPQIAWARENDPAPPHRAGGVERKIS